MKSGFFSLIFIAISITGGVCHAQDQLQDAANEWIRTDDELWLKLGDLNLREGRFEASESAFYRATEIYRPNLQRILSRYENDVFKDPSDDAARARLGYIYYMADKPNEARQLFQEAVQLNKGNQLARNGLDIIKGE